MGSAAGFCHTGSSYSKNLSRGIPVLVWPEGTYSTSTGTVYLYRYCIPVLSTSTYRYSYTGTVLVPVTVSVQVTVEPSVGPLTEKTVIDLCPKVDC